MPLDVGKVILIAVLAAVMIFVVYFEWNIMRSRGKQARKEALEKDEAFNTVLTTRSVIIALQRQGADTSKAQKLVDEAKLALQGGQYQRCKDLCELAKNSLTRPASAPAPKPSAVKTVPIGGQAGEEDSLLSVANEINTADRSKAADKYAGTKLRSDDDGNYMSAKFEINTATTSVKAADNKGDDVTAARGLLAEAEEAFAAGRYTKALSLAVKARKCVNAVTCDEAIKLRSSSRVKEEPAPAPPDESNAEETCESCGAPLEEDDMFCHKCGTKVAYEKECAGCGTTAKPEDVFCRKCGSKLD